MNITTVVRQLRKQRDRTAQELQRLNNALTALGTLDHRVTRRKRKVSAAARRRMAAAQRARRAKEKAAKS